MLIGFNAPTAGPLSAADNLTKIVVGGEAIGFDYATFSDHVVIPTAIAAALVTFVPPCVLAYAAFGFWDRFRATAWQQRVRRGLAPVTIGLVVAGGYVMAGTGAGWAPVAATAVATALMLATRINPLWLLAAGAALGGFGVV